MHTLSKLAGWLQRVWACDGVSFAGLRTQRRGSISAEHGIGVMKAAALGYSKSSAAVEIMRATKAMLDPCGILNPGKVLPSKA